MVRVTDKSKFTPERKRRKSVIEDELKRNFGSPFVIYHMPLSNSDVFCVYADESSKKLMDDSVLMVICDDMSISVRKESVFSQAMNLAKSYERRLGEFNSWEVYKEY